MYLGLPACLGRRQVEATRRLLSAFTAWVHCALRRICVIVAVANDCPRNVGNGMPEKFALEMCHHQRGVCSSKRGLGLRRKNILLHMPELCISIICTI